MAQEESYILGTDPAELHRLGVQHQVWAAEAQQGWENAKFRTGHTILDLGCGPGFCSTELAYLVGSTGKVIAVDRSENYIKYLNELSAFHGLKIDARVSRFEDLNLPENSLDGVYTRWALGWVDKPQPVLDHLLQALKPGGKFVFQEYYDWSVHAIYPSKPAITHAINTSLRSFKELESELDIGKDLPQMLEDMEMKIVSTRLMPKLGRPDNTVWQWPRTYYETYFPKLVETGYLTQAELEQAFKELEEIEAMPGASICGPLMVEVIAEKL